MKSRLIALVLAGVMLLTLAACQGAGQSGSAAPPSATEAGSVPAASENTTGYPIVAETLTLDVMWSYRDSDKLADFNSMWCTQQLEALTNIHVEPQMVSGSDFDTKLNLMFASGDYVDTIITGSAGVVDYEEYGVNQKLLLPVDDLIGQYMPIYNERINGESTDVLMGLRASDGQMYSVAPKISAQNINTTTHYFVNQTWLDAVDMTAPTTVDELTELLRAFKTEDPNGNGENDEIPFSLLFESDTSSVDAVMPFFGIPKTIWGSDDARYLYIDNDRKVQFAAVQPGFRACMEWLNMLYTEGLIDPEMLTQDATMLETKLSDGLVGFFGAWRLQGLAFSDWATENAVLIDPVAAEGYEVMMPKTMELANGGAYLTVGNEHVAETCRWLDAQLETEMMFTLTYGDAEVDGEGYGWFYNDEGLIESYPSIAEKTVHPALDVNALFFAPPTYYSSIYQMVPARIEKMEYCQQYTAGGYLQAYSNELMTLAPRTSEEISRCTLLQTDINNAVKEHIANFISKGVTDTSWDAFVGMFDGMHIEEYISIYQTALDNFDY